MHHPTRPPFVLVLALACAPNEQMSSTSKATHASDATASDSTTGTSAPPTSSTVATMTASVTTSSGSTNMGPSPCDRYLQDCPEGQKCAPVSTDGDSHWDTDICVPLDPNPAPPDAPCTSEGPASGIDSCEKGSVCINVDPDTGLGICVPRCSGSYVAPSCVDPSRTCIAPEEGIYDLCFPLCDPLDLGTCPDELCLPNQSGSGFVCSLDGSGGVGVVNASCSFYNACNPGLICVSVALSKKCDQNASACCQPYCDLDLGTMDNPACDTKGGQECLPLFDPGMAPMGYENIGVCGIPP